MYPPYRHINTKVTFQAHNGVRSKHPNIPQFFKNNFKIPNQIKISQQYKGDQKQVRNYINKQDSKLKNINQPNQKINYPKTNQNFNRKNNIHQRKCQGVGYLYLQSLEKKQKNLKNGFKVSFTSQSKYNFRNGYQKNRPQSQQNIFEKQSIFLNNQNKEHQKIAKKYEIEQSQQKKQSHVHPPKIIEISNHKQQKKRQDQINISSKYLQHNIQTEDLNNLRYENEKLKFQRDKAQQVIKQINDWYKNIQSKYKTQNKTQHYKLSFDNIKMTLQQKEKMFEKLTVNKWPPFYLNIFKILKQLLQLISTQNNQFDNNKKSQKQLKNTKNINQQKVLNEHHDLKIKYKDLQKTNKQLQQKLMQKQKQFTSMYENQIKEKNKLKKQTITQCQKLFEKSRSDDFQKYNDLQKINKQLKHKLMQKQKQFTSMYENQIKEKNKLKKQIQTLKEKFQIEKKQIIPQCQKTFKKSLSGNFQDYNFDLSQDKFSNKFSSNLRKKIEDYEIKNQSSQIVEPFSNSVFEFSSKALYSQSSQNTLKKFQIDRKNNVGQNQQLSKVKFFDMTTDLYKQIKLNEINYLLKQLQKQNEMKKKVQSLKLLYTMDLKKNKNFHKYIDNIKNILLIALLQSGNIIAGFSQTPVNIQPIKQKAFAGFLSSITQGNQFTLRINREGRVSNPKVIIPKEYQYVIFGNYELKLQEGVDYITSNLQSIASYFDAQSQGITLQQFLGKNKENKNNDVEVNEYDYSIDNKMKIKTYDFYKVIYQK